MCEWVIQRLLRGAWVHWVEAVHAVDCIAAVSLGVVRVFALACLELQ